MRTRTQSGYVTNSSSRAFIRPQLLTALLNNCVSAFHFQHACCLQNVSGSSMCGFVLVCLAHKTFPFNSHISRSGVDIMIFQIREWVFVRIPTWLILAMRDLGHRRRDRTFWYFTHNTRRIMSHVRLNDILDYRQCRYIFVLLLMLFFFVCYIGFSTYPFLAGFLRLAPFE